MRFGRKETGDFLVLLRGLMVVRPVTAAVHETGLRLAERYGFSVYDAMIAAAAFEANCTTIFSGDMQDGLMVEKPLRIINPPTALS